MRHVLLNFHGLGTPCRPLEPGEEPYWVSADFFGEVLELAAYYHGRTQTGFTFDDGNMSDIIIGAEGLNKRGWTAQFFVLANRIDTPGSLGRAELRALIGAGHSIGNHGAAHTSWREADAATLRTEVTGARARIAEASGAAVTAAAIPFGRYNKAVLTALRAEGYAQVYSSNGGAWRPGQWLIPRTSPRNDMSLADIETLLVGRELLRRRLRRQLTGAIKKRL